MKTRVSIDTLDNSEMQFSYFLNLKMNENRSFNIFFLNLNGSSWLPTKVYITLFTTSLCISQNRK